MSQSVQQVYPEFIEIPDNIEKQISSFNNILITNRNNKIQVLIKNSHKDKYVYNYSKYNYSKYSGFGDITNMYSFYSQIYASEGQFYEIFKSKEMLKQYPLQSLKGSIKLEYGELVKSKIINHINNYDLSFELESYNIGNDIYYSKKPIITDDVKLSNEINIIIRGYAILWKGYDYNKKLTFVDNNDLAKYNYSKYNQKLYSGGGMGFTGEYNDTAIIHGYLYATKPIGDFTSNTLVTSETDITKLKITPNQELNMGSIKYFVDLNGEDEWEEIPVINEYYELTNIGKNLRIKILIEGNAKLKNVIIDSDLYTVYSNIAVDSDIISVKISGVEVNKPINALSLPYIDYSIENITPNADIYLRLVKLYLK